MQEWQLDNVSETKVTRNLCSKWIADSWEEVKESTIINTSRHIGKLEI
jgi:hypothetical protein